MNNVNLGYACINMQLSYPQQWGNQPRGVERITTNRSMIRRTYDEKGVAYASQLSLANVLDLERIIDWNEANGIKFYRITSDLFPWASIHGISNMPDYQQIREVLKRCGDKAKKYGQRITCHPGPFNKLTSPKEHVVQNTITDLELHGEVFDMMGLPRTPWAKINIHVGAHYNDKRMAVDNFCNNFKRLSPAVQSRLTVENDDKASLYSTRELYEVHERIGIPIVFDYHHHKFCDGGQDEEEALLTACMTWGDVKPVVHYSQSRSEEHNNPKIRANAHSDSYWTPINTYGLDIDVMLECKHKEFGLYKMQELLKAS
jgi:UV DNA damage endonuclease